MQLKPRWATVECQFLNKQMKIWRSRKINGCHVEKLLRLWLGYDFLDLMDDYGRIPRESFPEAARRLGYKSSQVLLEHIRRSMSFYIVGISSNVVSAIFSPAWHAYEEADGILFSGSIVKDFAENSAEITEYNLNNNIYNNPNGVTAKAVSLERDKQVRRNFVRQYFEWITQQTDDDHVALVASIREGIRHVRTKKGEILPNQTLTEEQTDEVWKMLISTVLPNNLWQREDFFRKDYMQNPSKRVWWMKNLFKRYARGWYVEARRYWKSARAAHEAQKDRQRKAEIRSHCPLSPHEWMTPDDRRFYEDSLDGVMEIPPQAPPRPSASCHWNFIAQLWSED